MIRRILNFNNTNENGRISIIGALLLIVVGMIAVPVFAAAGDNGEMDWWNMGMKLFGGLALFLFGMEQMAESLKAVAGERMKIILARLTTNRFMGAATGAFVTAVIQSSSVTTVLVVGFITAGLMSAAQAIGVIMGANIGTTITAQIVAFKVTKIALLMVAIGFSMLFFSKHEKIKSYGGMLMGLGLVFFGMSVMSDAMKPLRSYQPFLDLMIQMENPLIGILVAAGFTALIQSSSATTGIVIVMASQGFITLPAGIALAFGANIGTCVTALLAAIGKPREAVRAAVVHVLFNVFGVIVWIGFIGYLADFVAWFSPQYPDLTGSARLAAETPRQIANAHTVFNVANTLIFIGFVGQFARMVDWLVPDKPFEEKLIVEPKYLDDVLLETPSLAMDRVRMEIGHMGERVEAMLRQSMPAFLSEDQNQINEISMIDDEVDLLYNDILTYLGKISANPLTEEQTKELSDLMAAVNDLESIGDVIETDAVALFEKSIEKGIKISDSTQEVLNGIHGKVLEVVMESVQAVMQNNERVAQRVIKTRREFNNMVEAAASHQAQRLLADEPERLAHYSIEVEIIEKLKRIYYFAQRIAQTIVPVKMKQRML